jgi:hypothetical protein
LTRNGTTEHTEITEENGMEENDPLSAGVIGAAIEGLLINFNVKLLKYGVKRMVL